MQFKDNLKSNLSGALQYLNGKYKKMLYGECAVLLYHRVANLETDPQLLAVSVSNFENQILYLKKSYNVLSIDELLYFVANRKKIPDKSVAITFDDGYADNYEFALPVLEKNNVQVLFYICTGNINTQKEFWWDELERAFLLSSREKNNQSYDKLLPELRKLSPAIRTEKIKKILTDTNAPAARQSHRSLTSDELFKLAKSKCAVIGAHTVHHPSLANLDSNEQRDEIKQSKDFLEKLLGFKIIHFSYPFGTRYDYNETTIKICADLGFKMVTINSPSMANSHSNLFSIPRFLVRDWDEKEFSIFMKKIFSR